MLCQLCEKREANTFVKKSVNGKTSAVHLCGECAAQQGIQTVFGHTGFDIGDFWSSLFAEPSVRIAADSVRCKGCGYSFEEMAHTGRAGCPMCYTTFYDRLLPSVQRIHGTTQHTGKVPGSAGEELHRARELEKLRRELNECIANQNFEDCARLRDAIRKIEKDEEKG